MIKETNLSKPKRISVFQNPNSIFKTRDQALPLLHIQRNQNGNRENLNYFRDSSNLSIEAIELMIE